MNISPSQSTKPTEPLVRWWPAVTILALAVVAVICIWAADFSSRQVQIQWTGQSLILAVLFMLVWLLFFSRLRWKVRMIFFGAVILLLGAIPALFRLRGISGDILPILEWRWAKSEGAALPASPPLQIDTTTAKISAQSSSLSENTPSLPVAPAAVEKKVKAAVREFSGDYPQFLGPHRNAMVNGIRLKRDWSKHPPKLVWRQSIGVGWSAFAVSGNFAVTQEQRGKVEMVVAYDLKSGQPKWSHGDSTSYESPITGNGPRATPTIAGNRVYTLGATGMLNCLDLADGRHIWSKNIIQENNSQVNGWGMSGSPLLLDSLVVVSAGGRESNSLVAYHQNTGARIWSGGNDRAAYSSPLVAMLAGVRQILIFNQNNIAAHDPATGQILWQQAWPGGSECVAQPLPLPGDRVFVSTGYGIGCKLFQIQRGENDGVLRAALVWQTTQLKAKFTNVIYREGYIYGLDDGILVGLDLANGVRKWKAGRYGHGQMISVGDLLLIQAESGDVILVEANPEAHRELARFHALDGKTWNNPALAGQYLLVRNDREAACYELAVEFTAL